MPHSAVRGRPPPLPDAQPAAGPLPRSCSPSNSQATSLMRMVHEFYTERAKHVFVHAFNHAPSTFDFKRMLDSMGHDTSNLPR